MRQNILKKADVFFEACREFEMAKRRIKPMSDNKFTVKIPLCIGEEYTNYEIIMKVKV